MLGEVSYNGKKEQKEESKLRHTPQIAESDNDDVYDEIDRFHNNRDSILNVVSQKPSNLTKEVLSVRVDDSDDDDDESLFNRKDEKLLKDINETTNKWGQKRSNFYGTSYVDKDFGGVNDSEEEEILDMEEKDAIARQKKQDSAMTYVNFDDFDDDGNSDENYCLSFPIKGNTTETVTKKKEKKQLDNNGKKISKMRKEKKDISMVDDELTLVVEEKDPTSGEKRAITYEIMKNKGLTIKRRKDSRHARIKNRKLYNKAIIKRRSQVPDVRQELTRYDGEKRGIRMSTIRSIKLQ